MKISPEMNQELRRAVASFNSKRARLIRKGVTPSLLPSRASVRLLKNAYKNSEMLNARIRELQEFSSAGEVITTKKGVKGTEAAFEYRKKINERMVQKYKSDIKEMRGMKTRYKAHKGARITNLQAKAKYLSRSPRNLTARDLERQNKNLMTPEVLYKKSEMYRENYFRKLEEYAEIGEVDPEKLKRLKVKLERVPVDDFYNIVNANPELTRVQDFMFDSPEAKGIKRVRPIMEPGDVKENFDELYNRIDDLLANSQVDFI